MSATIKDVAKRAGVSIASVSRVINGSTAVTPHVQQRVLDAIEHLQYYPNSIARSLKSESSKLLGMLVSDISNSYYTTLAKALEEEVRQEGYNIILCSTEADRERELEYLKLLASRKIDGLVLNSTGKNDDYVARLSRHIPVVLLHRRVEDPEFRGDFIDSSNRDGLRDMVKYLVHNGHNRIGVINGDLTVSVGRDRYEGFVQAMNAMGLALDDGYPYRYDANFSQDGGYLGAQHLLTLPDPPTAIITMNNVMTMGLLRYVRQKDICIPGQVSLLCYGNIENIDLLYVQPGYVTLDPSDLGRRAGEMLLDRMEGGVTTNRDYLFVPHFIKGHSVAFLRK